MVADGPKGDQRSIAVKAAIAVAVILVVTVWAGEFILGLFGGRNPQSPGCGRADDRPDQRVDAAQ